MSENTSAPRTLFAICHEIRQTWRNNEGLTQMRPDGPGYAAQPYFEAMEAIANTDNDFTPYYNDDAKSIVIYFLSNATSFRGEVARRVKAELKKKYGIK